MTLHRCYICMGSNSHAEANLAFARKELTTLFPNIRFGQEVTTKPYGFSKNTSCFHNQTAVFLSDKPIDGLQCSLKHIEQKAGRKPEDKCHEIVILDIDLVRYDEQVLKPDDLQRSYMRFPETNEIFINDATYHRY